VIASPWQVYKSERNSEQPLADLRAALRGGGKQLSDGEVYMLFHHLMAESRVLVARGERLGRKQGWVE
jgi:hypothetical protein